MGSSNTKKKISKVSSDNFHNESKLPSDKKEIRQVFKLDIAQTKLQNATERSTLPTEQLGGSDTQRQQISQGNECVLESNRNISTKKVPIIQQSKEQFPSQRMQESSHKSSFSPMNKANQTSLNQKTQIQTDLLKNKKVIQKQVTFQVAQLSELEAVQIDILQYLEDQNKSRNIIKDSIEANFLEGSRTNIFKSSQSPKKTNRKHFCIPDKQIVENLRPYSDLLQIITQNQEHLSLNSALKYQYDHNNHHHHQSQINLNKQSQEKQNIGKPQKQLNIQIPKEKGEMSFDIEEDNTLSPIQKQSQQNTINTFGDFGMHSFPLIEKIEKVNDSLNHLENNGLEVGSQNLNFSNPPQLFHSYPHIINQDDGNFKRTSHRSSSIRFLLPASNLEKIRESDEKEEDIITRAGGSRTEFNLTKKKISGSLISSTFVKLQNLHLKTNPSLKEEEKKKTDQDIENQEQGQGESNYDSPRSQRSSTREIKRQSEGISLDLVDSDPVESYFDSDSRLDSDRKISSLSTYRMSHRIQEPFSLPQMKQRGTKRSSLFFSESLRLFESLSKHQVDSQDQEKSPLEDPNKSSTNRSMTESYNLHSLSQQMSLPIKTSDDHKIRTPIHNFYSQSASPTSHNCSPSNNSYINYFSKNHDNSVIETSIVKKQVNDEGLKIINNYKLFHELGRGGFGKVKLAEQGPQIEGSPTQQFAIKISNKKKLKTKLVSMKINAFTLLEREVAIMKKIDHPHLVKLFEVIDDPEDEKIYMVMEYMQKGSILSSTYWKKELQETNPKLFQQLFGEESDTLMKKKKQELLPKKLPMEKCRKYFQQFALAIDYMHNQAQVIHRDIKPENILINDEDNLKIGDFGVSHIMDSSKDSEIKDNAGTKAYTAPEGWTRNFKGKPLDMWASGVTLYQMAFGELPFFSKDQMKLKELIINEQVKIPPNTDPMLADLVLKLLVKDPDERITAEEMLVHPWLTQNNLITLKNIEVSDIKVSDTDLQKAFTKKLQFATLMRVKMKLNRQLSKARTIILQNQNVDNSISLSNKE